MSSGINEGIANETVVQAEASFLGTLTGPAYALPGRLSLQVQPRLSAGALRTGIYRTQDGDSFAAVTWGGSIEVEYPGGEAFALLLSSLLKRTGSSPNYVFGQSHLATRQTLALSLKYVPNNLSYLFRGLVVEALELSVQLRGLVRCRLELAAGRMDTGSPITATVTPTHVPAPSWKSALQYRGVDMPRAYEATARIVARVEFCRFGETGIPGAVYTAGGTEFSAEIAEWMGDTSGADTVPADVRGLVEVSQRIDVEPFPGKLLRIELPRSLPRSGTPPGLVPGGIAYRIGSEAQGGEASPSWPAVTMTV